MRNRPAKKAIRLHFDGTVRSEPDSIRVSLNREVIEMHFKRCLGRLQDVRVVGDSSDRFSRKTLIYMAVRLAHFGIRPRSLPRSHGGIRR